MKIISTMYDTCTLKQRYIAYKKNANVLTCKQWYKILIIGQKY